MVPPIAGKPAPTLDLCQLTILWMTADQCGSGLARDGVCQANAVSAGETMLVLPPRDLPELRYSAIDSCVTSPRNTRSASITGNHERLNSYMRDSRMRKCSSNAAVALNSRKYCAHVPV